MKARQVADIIEGFAPLDTQESWDNAGLCIGSPDTEVKGVMVGFDCTPALIEEAVAAGCNMVVTHHPLIFRGVKRIDPDTFTGAAIVSAIKHDVVVYSAHTNADKAADGVSWLMAAKLGMREVSALGEDGLGAVGDLPEAMDSSRHQFGTDRMTDALNLDPDAAPAEILGNVRGSVSEFVKDAEPFDDLTMLCMEYKG